MEVKLNRILLVEDNPNDAELTLEALGQHNLTNEVEWVKDGQQALDYLNQQGDYANRTGGNPGLIMLDLKLPKIDGLEVLRVIKTTDSLKIIPVVVLTSSREERDLTESYNLGVNAYVVKPVDFHDFMKAVTELGVFWALINEPPLQCRK